MSKERTTGRKDMQKTSTDDERRAEKARGSGSSDKTTCSDDSRFFVAAGIVDGSGAALRRDVVVEVRHGLIAAIRTATRPPQGAMVEDFSHCLLLPAVIDASVLLARSPSLGQHGDNAVPAEPGRRATLIERHLSYCHGHGVLGLAVGDDPALLPPDFAQRATSRGLLEVRLSLPPCEDAGTTLARDSAKGFLRVFYSADIDDDRGAAGAWQPMDEAQRRALLRNRGKRKVVAVANGEEAVAAALAEGCDAIEQGYFMGEDNLRLMAAGGVLWIPSLVRAKNGLDGSGEGGDIACRFSQRYLAPGKAAPGAADLWKKTLAEQMGRLALARSLGVRTALGSGAGNSGLLHGEALVEEMKLFQKAGYPLGEIFQAAAENAARFFAMERLGMLAPGRPATFLVTRGTAQQLPRKLYFLQAIVVDGRPCPVYRRDPVKVVARSRSGG